jgi:phosphonoacetaldehyde hydrolase
MATTMALKLRAVVFDWAGTMIDFGSRAPMGVLVRAYAQFGVDITVAEARGPMGRAKRDHIAALMALPRVRAAWAARHGQPPGEGDIDRVYEAFVPMNVEVAADYAEMIPGAVEAVRALRARGLKIGSTTGYTREIMARVLPRAAAAGYSPDNLVCAGDLAEGRPSPLMMYRTMADLGVYPPSSVVKVDDTVPGIEEGRAAGTWTVGVTASGNEVGLSLEEWSALPEQERHARAERAAAVLRHAGAHYLVDTVADLPAVIDDIERRLAAGGRPPTRETQYTN